MRTSRARRGVLLVACLALGTGCAVEAEPAPGAPLDFPGGTAGKTDVFGRALAGVAADYEANLTMDLQIEAMKLNTGLRRQIAWQVVERVIDPVPLLGLAEASAIHEEIQLPDGEVPTVPRYQTWYGVDDFKRMFRKLYEDLGPEERATRAAFSGEALDDIFVWNAAAAERSERWPLERFFDHVNQLGVCPPGTPGDQCALSLQSKFSGSTAGNARITYSPGTMRHLLENYGTMLDCLHTLDVLTFSTIPPNEDQNFSHCFTEEFPKDAVLMKAHWVRADFNRKMPAFDTDGAALAERLASTKVADWGGGDRMVDPTPDEVFTIRLKGGDTYRLAGLHIMSKELRHWMWITLWWSDEPNVDFGADRPATMAALDPVWSRYKMGVVVDYNEADLNPAQWFPNAPTLAASLQAVQHERSWLSNPYIEHGRGNARTNCVGCHQHGGSTVGHDLNGDGAPDAFDLEAVIDNETLFQHNGRAQMRSVFPADYLWSTTRVDDLSELLRSEVTNWDIQDQLDPTIRALAILNLEGDASVGSARFQKSCSTCHGAEGAGTGAAPSLYDRVPKLDDEGLAAILLSGRAPMPSWSHLDNQELADVIAFLRENFSLTP